MVLILGGRAQGKTEYAAAQYPKSEIVNAYHETVRRELECGNDPLALAEQMLKQHDPEKLVVISDEIGCGIVPLDPFERSWREVNGRVNCFLAQKADAVIRVTAGIGQRIK